ncbi:DUF3489 domain-containing protein [Sphingopyxis sp. KK2]|uniref:DUF3489 domain-containing protein n=1 Tax=Sphingopyxis sp. KK2 TaxID=1855727 RepID=UPI00097E63AE|nr:DUF3489 domain-containing protein [Sphingopyxis sp. KK2]
MTTKTDTNEAPGATNPTKSTAVATLLTRSEGATLEDLTTATGWQPHSCRAYLTGLRKKGWAITRSKCEGGASAWHGMAPAITAGAGEA